MSARSLLSFVGLAGITTAAVTLSSRSTGRRSLRRYYGSLRRPSWSPPARAFGAIWAALYAAMTASAWRLSQKPSSPSRNRALALWATQLGLNAAWTPIFFRWRRPWLALADVLALGGVLAAYTEQARRVDKPAAWMMAPYLGWTATAAVLNAEVARRNASQ